MWEVDKEGYIRRYEKAQKGLSSFEADILKYMQLQEEVQVRGRVDEWRPRAHVHKLRMHAAAGLPHAVACI